MEVGPCVYFTRPFVDVKVVLLFLNAALLQKDCMSEDVAGLRPSTQPLDGASCSPCRAP